MRSKKSAVVGVLITVYLSTDAWCHYIPEKPPQRNVTARNGQIQICGNALTTLILEACDGIVTSLEQGNVTRESVRTKITEDCCDHGCPLEYIQDYCGQTPLFTIKKTLRGKLLSKLTRNRSGEKERPLEQSAKKKGVSEVRAKGRKRKRSFKRKCAYKSFGHYLLKLDWGERVRTNHGKEQNAVNRTWPSLEIGTISPEIEKFGGQPIVVVKKKKI